MEEIAMDPSRVQKLPQTVLLNMHRSTWKRVLTKGNFKNTLEDLEICFTSPQVRNKCKRKKHDNHDDIGENRDGENTKNNKNYEEKI